MGHLSISHRGGTAAACARAGASAGCRACGPPLLPSSPPVTAGWPRQHGRHTVLRRGAIALRCGIALAWAVAGVGVTASPSEALPAFARLTGLPCAACHTNFPLLTPLGREFKMKGYQFDTTTPTLGQFAMMTVSSLTHTEAGQPGGAAKGFGDNDNLAQDQISLFYGGPIYSRLAAFVQATYDGVADHFALDNTDFRLANTFQLREIPVTLGLTANNNPTVQDPWNTTPAWGYPFVSSRLAPTPAASPLIAGGLAAQVYGLGAYSLVNNLVYLEVGGYHHIDTGAQQALGVFNPAADIVEGFAPYWRVALQHNWDGGHYLSLGTFGLDAHTFPGGDQRLGSDRRTDLGVDLEYQWIVPRHSVTVLATGIGEHQRWKASQGLGLTANSADTLNTVKVTGTYMFDLTYALYGTYFTTWGTRDPTLYAPAPISGSRTGRPNSNGWIVEFDYLPFNRSGGPSLWRWFNPKFVVQYTIYNEFNGASHNYDGSGRNASHNNTLYVAAWFAF